MDNILFTELRRLHETLRREETQLHPDDKMARHLGLVEHCEAIMNYCNIARKEGLLALEEAALKKEIIEETFECEIIHMICEGSFPESIKQISLLKYFSIEQTTIEGIQNIMSIYGLLSVQAGENPLMLQRMLASMAPSDVREQILNIPW